jgi:alkylation response protein AidB-like acyl-CoA dehydrogenase
MARSLLDAPTEELPSFWPALASLGWLGLHLSEEYGGSGFGLVELAGVLEELGRVAAPGPFLPTVMASAIVADRGSDELRGRLLRGLADGSTVAGVGLHGSLVVEDGAVSGDAGIVVGA